MLGLNLSGGIAFYSLQFREVKAEKGTCVVLSNFDHLWGVVKGVGVEPTDGAMPSHRKPLQRIERNDRHGAH